MTRSPADQLTGKIKDRIANRVDKRVYVRADARARFGSVVDVVDNVRAAGVDQLGLLTDQKKNDRRYRPPPQRSADRRTIKEIYYGNGSWPERGPEREHQRDTAHRCAAGAADHLHGDHAVDAQGSGRAGAAAAAAQRSPRTTRPTAPSWCS